MGHENSPPSHFYPPPDTGSGAGTDILAPNPTNCGREVIMKGGTSKFSLLTLWDNVSGENDVKDKEGDYGIRKLLLCNRL